VNVLSWIGVTVSGHTLNNLCYADDIVLIATTPTALQQLIDKVDAVSRDVARVTCCPVFLSLFCCCVILWNFMHYVLLITLFLTVRY